MFWLGGVGIGVEDRQGFHAPPVGVSVVLLRSVPVHDLKRITKIKLLAHGVLDRNCEDWPVARGAFAEMKQDGYLGGWEGHVSPDGSCFTRRIVLRNIYRELQNIKQSRDDCWRDKSLLPHSIDMFV